MVEGGVPLVAVDVVVATVGAATAIACSFATSCIS